MAYDKMNTRGRWRSILGGLGVPEKVLDGSNQPCPFCGGKDRFRFTDHNGDGMWYCNRCGGGNGIQFVQQWCNCDFKHAARAVEDQVPGSSVTSTPPRAANDDRMRDVWRAAVPVTEGDPVWEYLKWRAVLSEPLSDQIRYTRLPYWHNGERGRTFDCMLSLIRSGAGKPVSLHATYLGDDGEKAKVPSPKKVLMKTGSNPRIELFPCSDRLALAEGVETSLAVKRDIMFPVWSTVSAGGMENFVCPESVKILHVYGDNDESFTGQLAAYRLAQRLRAEGKEVRVLIPNMVGYDWADVGVT